jgi:pimeloyl-ACP methyl ester carboxylesterase
MAEQQTAEYQSEVHEVGDAPLHLLRAGGGRPLVIFHDELGFPGWMRWNDALSETHDQIIPLQPGFGATPRLEWVRSYRDLAGFYARWLRELRRREAFAEGVDAIGFSAGGYIAAEMAAADPGLFRRLVLVAPLGIKPEKGFIFDFLAVTIRNHLLATVHREDAPEFAQIYGGEMTPAQFERFEEARSETARLGWEPFMYNPSLPHLLGGVTDLPTLIVRGTEDRILPRDAALQYRGAIAGAKLTEIAGVGHRPEIEDSAAFVSAIVGFFD